MTKCKCKCKCKCESPVTTNHCVFVGLEWAHYLHREQVHCHKVTRSRAAMFLQLPRTDNTKTLALERAFNAFVAPDGHRSFSYSLGKGEVFSWLQCAASLPEAIKSYILNLQHRGPSPEIVASAHHESLSTVQEDNAFGDIWWLKIRWNEREVYAWCAL